MIAVARILGDCKRQQTRVFSELQIEITCSRTSLAARQGERLRPNVEGIVGYCQPELPGADAKVPELWGISTRILKPAAPTDGRNNCVATTKRSVNASKRYRAVLQRLRASAYDACDMPPRPLSSLWLARLYAGTDYSGTHTVRPLRGAGPKGMSTRWSSVAPKRQKHKHPCSYDFKTTSIIDPLTLSVLAGAKDQRRWISRLPWPAGFCRRCSASLRRST